MLFVFQNFGQKCILIEFNWLVSCVIPYLLQNPSKMNEVPKHLENKIASMRTVTLPLKMVSSLAKLGVNNEVVI